MANKQIIDLIEDTAPVAGDMLVKQAAAGGASSTKKSTAKNWTRAGAETTSVASGVPKGDASGDIEDAWLTSNIGRLDTAQTHTAAKTFNPGTTSAETIIVTIAALTSVGTRDSHLIRLTGQSYDTAAHQVDWRENVDVTSNAGASSFVVQSRIDAAAFGTRFDVTDAGVASAGGTILVKETRAVNTTGSLTGGGTLAADRTLDVLDNGIADAEIAAHTSTKITITARGQLPSQIAYEDEANDFGTSVQTFDKVELDDIDATPVADRRLSVIDGLIRSRTTVDAEGRFISKASLEEIGDAEVASGAAIAKSKISTTGTWVKADLPASVAYEDEANDFGTNVQTFDKVELDDIDATPVADRRLTVIDGLVRARTTADAEGRFISKASLEEIGDAEVSAGAAIAKSKISTTGTWVKADLPAAVAYEDEANDFGTSVQTFDHIEIDDTDATVVADRRLAVIDGLVRTRDTANAEGRFLSKASLEQIADAEVASAAAIAKSKISTTGTWVKADLPAAAAYEDEANSFTLIQTINPGTTPTTAIDVTIGQPTTAGTRDSHVVLVTGTSFDTAGHDADWREFVDVTTNAGASTWTVQSRIDAATFADRFTVNDAGVASAGGTILTKQSRLVSTSEGVQGGGDLSADRTHKLDINGLTEDTAPAGAADFVATYDASAALHKKVLLNNLPGGGGGYTTIQDEGTALTARTTMNFIGRAITGVDNSVATKTDITVHVGKSIAKTAAYTATATDSVIICDATTAAFTVTMPAAASSADAMLHIKKIDNSVNAVTIDGNAAETIDKAATYKLTARFEAVTLSCDGTEWWIL